MCRRNIQLQYFNFSYWVRCVNYATEIAWCRQSYSWLSWNKNQSKYNYITTESSFGWVMTRELCCLIQKLPSPITSTCFFVLHPPQQILYFHFNTQFQIQPSFYVFVITTIRENNWTAANYQSELSTNFEVFLLSLYIL